MESRPTRVLMNREEIAEALSRMADEILSRKAGSAPLALVGIRTRGVPLARRLARLLRSRVEVEVPVGVLDITLYRDDLSDVASQPIVRDTEIPFAVGGKRIVLVDDVLFTGRTVRAALDELIDFGRPQRIELLVLIDRGGRELPIEADYVGRKLATSPDQSVSVLLEEEDGREEVVLLERRE